MLIFRIPKMTEDMARNALLSFVNSKCCYGNRAAGHLVIQELKQQIFCRVSIPKLYSQQARIRET